MKPQRKITVSISVHLNDLAMDSTSAALETVRSVITSLGDKCHDEIKQALEEAGAKDVAVRTLAY